MIIKDGYIPFFSPIQIGNTTLASGIINTPQLQATEYICCPEFITATDDYGKSEPQYTRITTNTIYTPSIKTKQATIGPAKIDDNGILCSNIQCNTIKCTELIKGSKLEITDTIKVSKLEINDKITGSALTINGGNGVIDCELLAARTKIRCNMLETMDATEGITIIGNITATEHITATKDIKVKGKIIAEGNIITTGDIIAKNLPVDNNTKVDRALWGAALSYMRVLSGFQHEAIIEGKRGQQNESLELVTNIDNGIIKITVDREFYLQAIVYKKRIEIPYENYPYFQFREGVPLERYLSIKTSINSIWMKVKMTIENPISGGPRIVYTIDEQEVATSPHANCTQIKGTDNRIEIIPLKFAPGLNWGPQ